jgi:hypothetical protein
MKNTFTFLKNLVSILHQNGFDHDFTFSGNEILWVQQKKFIRAGDFAILEWHWLYKEGKKAKKMLVIGLSALPQGAKGILIVDPKNGHSQKPPILIKKFNELIGESMNDSIITTN